MPENDADRLVEKLRLIEALYAGAATPGEKVAAGEARNRILARLAKMAENSPPEEMSFSLRNPWSHRLFIALLRRYNIVPYRYARQRHTTVTARIPRRFLDETLWPEFIDLNQTLYNYLSEVTERVISEGIYKDTSEVQVHSGDALPGTNVTEG